MRAIRGRKGLSLVELLIVLLLIAFALTLVSFAVLPMIDRARGATATAEARSVYITAQGVMLQYSGHDALSDRDLAEGLSGTVDNILYPEKTELSQRINELLAPDIVLTDEPGDGKSKAEFTVENGVITKLIYQAENNGDIYQATIVPGEDAVIERVE